MLTQEHIRAPETPLRMVEADLLSIPRESCLLLAGHVALQNFPK